jgi:hypothetical protein
MTGFGGEPENIYSHRVFRILTHNGHLTRSGPEAPIQDGDRYLYSILMVPTLASRLMKFFPPGMKAISRASFPRQLDTISAPGMRPTNALLRSGENDRSVGAILAHTESGTVALHSCRKT